MICPNCGSSIPDGALRCPACHADLSLTIKMPRVDGTWCSSCGTRIEPGQDVCPNCGMPVPVAPKRQAEQERQRREREREEALEKEETHAMPRIESAIPSEPDAYDVTAKNDRLPRTRVMVLSILAALLVVGGSVLYITHPWNPEMFDTRATTPADTSKAGYPGQKNQLTGQDGNDSSSSAVVSGDDATFAALTKEYGQLEKLSKRLDDNEDLFESVCMDKDVSKRKAGQQAARQVSLDISNLISDIQKIDVTSGTYAQDSDHLTKLGNYLRNRSDVLSAAWEIDLASDDPQENADAIASSLSDSAGNSLTKTYRDLFNEYYDEWKPVRRSASK